MPRTKGASGIVGWQRHMLMRDIAAGELNPDEIAERHGICGKTGGRLAVTGGAEATCTAWPGPPGVPGFPGFFPGRTSIDFPDLLTSNPISQEIEVGTVDSKPREPREPRELGPGRRRCLILPDDPVNRLLKGPVGALWVEL